MAELIAGRRAYSVLLEAMAMAAAFFMTFDDEGGHIARMLPLFVCRAALKARKEGNPSLTEKRARGKPQHPTDGITGGDKAHIPEARSQNSEDKSSGEAPPADLQELPLWMLRVDDSGYAKVLWNQGLAFVAKSTGKSPGACRPLLGRWCKAAGDDHQWLWTKLAEAARDQRGEIVSWIEACLKAKGEERPGLDPSADHIIRSLGVA